MWRGTEFSKIYPIHGQKSSISSCINLETRFAFSSFGQVDMPVPVNLWGKG